MVSFSRGWPLLIIGLLLSVFLGGALRVFFSPPRVRIWVERIIERRQPKFALEFENAKLTLADGFIPQLAIEFRDVRVLAKDPCVTGAVFTAERLNVPIQFQSLFQNRIKLGTIVIDEGGLRYKKSSCEESLVDSNLASSPPNPKEKFKAFLQERWVRDIKKADETFYRLSISRLQFFWMDLVDPLYELEDFSVWIEGQEPKVHFEGSLIVGYQIRGPQPLGAFRTQGSISQKEFWAEGKGNLKEGQYSLDIKINFQTEAFQAKKSFKDVPMLNLVSLLNRWGLVRWQNFNPRHQWLSCRVHTKGNLQNWFQATSLVDQCELYGDLGRWTLRSGDMHLFRKELFPLMMSVKGMDVRLFTKAHNWTQHLENIVQPGTMDFEFEFQNRESFFLHGLWRNAIFQWKAKDDHFESFPVKQTQIRFEKTAKHLTLDLRDLVWGQGKLEGLLRVEKNRETDQLLWSWNVKALKVPQILYKMAGANQLQGLNTHGEIIEKSPGQYVGSLEASMEQLSLEGIRFESTELKMSLDGENGVLDGKSLQGSIAELNSWEYWLKKFKTKPEVFSNFQFQSVFDLQGRWHLKQLRAETAQQAFSFRGKGFRNAFDRAVFTIGSDLTWNVFGTLQEPRLEIVH